MQYSLSLACSLFLDLLTLFALRRIPFQHSPSHSCSLRTSGRIEFLLMCSIFTEYQNAETTKSKKLTDEESKNGNKIQHTKPNEITKMETKSRWSCANAVASGSQQHNTTHDIMCAVCVLDTWFWCYSVPASQVYRVVVKEKNYKRSMSICLNCGNIPFLFIGTCFFGCCHCRCCCWAVTLAIAITSQMHPVDDL